MSIRNLKHAYEFSRQKSTLSQESEIDSNQLESAQIDLSQLSLNSSSKTTQNNFMEESTVDIVIAATAVEHFSKHPSIKLFGGIKTKMPSGASKTPKVRPPKGEPGGGGW